MKPSEEDTIMSKASEPDIRRRTQEVYFITVENKEIQEVLYYLLNQQNFE